jgi:FlaG/FlaF family flagellin (archaellin)
MVAITVILAAVIGTFVLGLGSGTSQSATAGVNYDEPNTQVTLTSLGSNTEGIYCSTSSIVESSGDWGIVAGGAGTEKVGGSFSCGIGENVVAYTTNGDNTTIRTNLGN